jgi:V8-like Glu-specific endopeptidase
MDFPKCGTKKRTLIGRRGFKKQGYPADKMAEQPSVRMWEAKDSEP